MLIFWGFLRQGWLFLLLLAVLALLGLFWAGFNSLV